MLRLSGVILCMLFFFTHGNAQVKIENNRNIQQVQRKGDVSKQVQRKGDLSKQIKDKSYKEVSSASTFKNISANAEKKYPGAKVEKIFKNREGVYGIVLFHPKERAIPANTRRAYGRLKKENTKLKIDRNRQVVFFDGRNWGDETNLPSDVFLPSDTRFPSDIFFPGDHFFPSDIFFPSDVFSPSKRKR